MNQQEPARFAERIELVERMRKLRDEAKQIVDDTEHWNRQNPEEEPIDPDPDGRLSKIISACSRSLMREDSR